MNSRPTRNHNQVHSWSECNQERNKKQVKESVATRNKTRTNEMIKTGVAPGNQDQKKRGRCNKPGIGPGRNGKGGGHCGPETKPGSGNLTWKQTGKKLWQGFVPGITLVVLCGEKNSWSGAIRNDQNDHQESLCVPGEFQADSFVVKLTSN